MGRARRRSSGRLLMRCKAHEAVVIRAWLDVSPFSATPLQHGRQSLGSDSSGRGGVS